MTTLTEVVDTDSPSETGKFIRWSQQQGRRIAVVRFSNGCRNVPEDRVQRAVKPGPTGVTADELLAVQDRYGFSPADVRRIARGNRVTVRQAVDELLECDAGCECEACKEAPNR